MCGAILMQYVLISSIKPNERPPFDLASSKCSQFLAHDRMSVASLCNPDLSVVVVVVVVVVVCEHSS